MAGRLVLVCVALLRLTDAAAPPQRPLLAAKAPVLDLAAQLVAARPAVAAPTPAAKLLEVARLSATELMVLLALLRGAAALLYVIDPTPPVYVLLTTLVWLAIVQGSSRLQGVMQKPTEVLSPDWYAKLTKPSWNPPAWAFPVAWIPLKLLQVAAASVLWRRVGLRVFASPSVILFVLHLTLGDVWNRQFFLKQRLLTGLLVIATFWLVLVAATTTFFAQSSLAGALLAPSVAWVAVAASLNLDTWYLNR